MGFVKMTARQLLLLAAALLMMACPAATAFCAEEELVGLLALAVEPEVVEQLGLSEEQVEKLLEVVDQRESEALDQVLQMKDLAPAERWARLAPFRATSEKIGLAVLSPEQKQRLLQIRLQRSGLAALGDAEVVGMLDLADEQQEKLAAVLQQRREELGRLRGEEAARVRQKYEARLAALLSGEQREKWSQIADVPAPEPSPPGTASEPSSSSSAAGGQRPAGSQAAAPAKEPTVPPGRDDMPAGSQDQVAGDGKLYFNFKYERWKDVLEWFADQAQLSLNMDVPPDGTLNYTDTRGYTPTEALNVINSVLLTKGYTLLRRDRALILVELDGGIPPNLVRSVPVEELDELGEYEVVRTLFPLEKMTATEAEAEVKNLIGPHGSIAVLPTSNHIQVVDTVGRLRQIRRVIEAVEGPAVGGGGDLKQFELKFISADEALPVVRKLLNIPEETDAAADQSLRLAVDLTGSKIIASGKQHRLAELEQVLKAIDVPAPGSDQPAGPLEQPQLEVYAVHGADPESVLEVLQTLMAGVPDIRLATDPKTGNLVALARPSQHRTIQATLDQMQKDADQIEVIRLRTVDPQVAVLAINKLFGGEKNSDTAPTVDADLNTGSLLIKASAEQVRQIRSLLGQMGEDDSSAEVSDEPAGPVRMIPLSGRQVRMALGQIEQVWPTMRRNKIRVVSPSRAIPTYRSQSGREAEGTDETAPPIPGEPGRALPRVQPPAPKEQQPQGDPSAHFRHPQQGGMFRFAVQSTGQPLQEETARPSGEPAGAPAADKGQAQAAGDPAAKEAAPPEPPVDGRKQGPADKQGTASKNGDAGADAAAGAEPPEIVVAPGTSGTMIASEDIEALDEFEELLNALAGRYEGGLQFTVFYLKYAKADAVAETLRQIFGAAGGGAGGGGGDGLLGDIANAALGDLGGGLVGDLLGGGGGASPLTSATTGEIHLVADARLNALVVQALPPDLDMLEQLLQILDQQASPEDVEVIARPKLIPVYNTNADQVAEVVRQIYQDRITTAAAAQAPQGPSPRDFIQALRGGRSGGRGNAGGSPTELPKMTIGVDARSNSLVVSAPQPLFEEVRELVRELDEAGIQSEDTMQVVTLRKSNPQAVGRALQAILGEAVQTTADTSVDAAAAAVQGAAASRPGGGDDRAQDMDAIRRRIEFFRRMREQRDRGREGGNREEGGNRRSESSQRSARD